MRSACWILLSLILCPTAVICQDLLRFQPKREVRAVWLTTVLGLDWPKSHEALEQQRSLTEIVEKLSAAHFNTIFFQVRSRADAMYASEYEPWSPQLSGTLGEDPGWDPLTFLLTEAHARGMEVHAWFNTNLARNVNDASSKLPTVSFLQQHSDWVKQIEGGEYWFDPGIPVVRKYLLRVAMDVVRRYDVDGMHFDFIRYPQKQFPDNAAYKRYGHGMQKDDWRRENINAFIHAFHDSALAVKPMLKIGAAPIGIYMNTDRFRGLQGFSELSQDSRKWIEEGWLDYLAPQVYWSLGQTPGDPDFASVAHDWVQNSSHRHIYLGIGAYKPDVFNQLAALIDTSRSIGAQGTSFFRWESVSKLLNVDERYRTPALVPPMTWKDSILPEPPRGLVVSLDESSRVRLQWQLSLQAPDGDEAKKYVVYWSPTTPIDIERSENLLAILPEHSLSYTDTSKHSRFVKNFYAVTALDKGNNESIPVVASMVPPEIAAAARQFSSFTLGKTYPNPASSIVFIPYEIGQSSPVAIKILDRSNREMVGVVDAIKKPGRYIAAADISKLHDGTYTYVLVAGDQTVRKTFRIDN